MKCGFIVLAGRPSVGKSTLLNALCEKQVAITSPVPQTTRRSVRGIVNRREGQLIFLDTPGYHASNRKFNNYLKNVLHRSLNDADLVLYVLDASREPGQEEEALMELLVAAKLPVVVAVNKIDLASSSLEFLRGLVLTNLKPFAMVNISAIQGEGLEALVDALLDCCPEGKPHYPEDFYTDQEPEFRIAELIREQAIARTSKEVPHAIYVEIADMEFREHTSSPQNPAPRKRLWVRAFIMVESTSQVGIIVGKRGDRIKAIRLGTQQMLKKIFPWKIELDLRVKVNPRWRRKDALLKKMLGA